MLIVRGKLEQVDSNSPMPGSRSGSKPFRSPCDWPADRLVHHATILEFDAESERTEKVKLRTKILKVKTQVMASHCPVRCSVMAGVRVHQRAGAPIASTPRTELRSLSPDTWMAAKGGWLKNTTVPVVQSPSEIPSARAVRARLPSGRTVFNRPTASLIFTEPTCEPR